MYHEKLMYHNSFKLLVSINVVSVVNESLVFSCAKILFLVSLPFVAVIDRSILTV